MSAPAGTTKRQLVIVEVEVDEEQLQRKLTALAAETRPPQGVQLLTDDPARALFEAVFNAAEPAKYGVRCIAFGVRQGSFDQDPPLIPPMGQMWAKVKGKLGEFSA